jgi:hypothetical protein
MLVPGTDKMCLAKLSNGTSYELHRRILKAQHEGQPVYVDVLANYVPGSGEFLFVTMIYTNHGYLTTLKDREKLSCAPNLNVVRLLEDGEWAEFYALNGTITVRHSRLQFPQITQAWHYVSAHFEEYTVDFTSTKCCEVIPLFKELGRDFFRPERLRFDARPFNYNSLVSAKKAGATWEVEIKGADEPNRAFVVLGSDFKLMEVRKFAAPK